MKISTKGRYGMMAMLDLARHYGEGFILVKDIARRQRISEQYLEQLLILLKAAGMVRSTRGARGGFTLAKPPSQIRLSEIIQVMEGSMAPVECVDAPEAYPRVASCAVHDVWVEITTAMSSVLESITLQELVERQAKKEATAKASEEQNCHC
jgi:Rrf2 family protein